MYHPAIVQLPPATLAETRSALEEVKDFATTDMGRGGPHRWAYRILREPELTQELARQAPNGCSEASELRSGVFESGLSTANGSQRVFQTADLGVIRGDVGVYQ